jgi:hypothetical protein
MYGKAFASMYTGSMFGAGIHVFAVWNYIIANADAKGYVEINPRMLAATLGGTATEVQSAIDYLTSSDENSRNPDEEGRRIVREGQFLFRIVSYLRYRDVRNAEAKKQYDRNYRRQQRAKEKSSMSSDDVAKNTTVVSASLQSSQVEEEVIKHMPKASPLAMAEKIYWAYPRHVDKQDALRAIEKALRKLEKERRLGADWLLGQVETFAAQCEGWSREEKRFIKYPATWFNKGSYDDESLVPKEKFVWEVVQ